MNRNNSFWLSLALGSCLIGWVLMPNAADPGFWTPWRAGAGIGVLSWLTFLFSDKPVGASTSYASLAGLLGLKIAPQHTQKLKYFQEHPPKVGWEMIFVLAAIAGSFLAAISGDDFEGRWLSPMWVSRFGDSLWLRFLVAFSGGIFMAFGARMAGGCTSGHGISGTMQLAVSSWIMVIALFVGGIATATFMYGGV